MTISILSDPSHVVQVSPEIVSRWLATECPNNFRLQRKDWIVSSCEDNGGFLQLNLATDFIGNSGDSVSVYNSYTQAMLTGTITSLIGSPVASVVTDIPWIATMNITYLNDNTYYSGFYFEGRLTVNGVVQDLTIISSPDSFGKADLDVSGILKIKTSLGKTGDYSTTLMKEPTKGGKFTFAFRPCWYGSNESYTEEGNTWYYVEAIRSQEQGSNMYEFVYTAAEDGKFLNSFDQPVYFNGLPFDLSFLLPLLPVTSPVTELTVTIKRYNANNTLLSTTTEILGLSDFEEKVISLNIDPATIEESAAYMTIEIA